MWNEELDRHLPKFLRGAMLISLCFGLAMLVTWILLSTGSFKMTIDGQRVETTVLSVLSSVGALLIFIPAACFSWVKAKLPPSPTHEDHSKVLNMKRLLERLDAEEAGRIQSSV